MSHVDFVPGLTVERRKQSYAGNAYAAGILIERRRRPFVYSNTGANVLGSWSGNSDCYSHSSEKCFAALEGPAGSMANEQLFSLLAAFQERERERVAADLHDSIGAALTAVKYRIEESIQQLHHKAPDTTIDRLHSASRELARTIEEVRRIAMNLRPAMLDDLGIVATINWYCREIGGCYENLHLTKRIDIEERAVPAPLKTAIFRILQEAVNNTIKHSGASELYVDFSKVGQTIRLSVMDNGSGFDMGNIRKPSEFSGGFGSIGMRQRMKCTGGNLQIKSTPGAGTQVIAEWPLYQS